MFPGNIGSKRQKKMTALKLTRLLRTLRHPDSSKRRVAAEALSNGDERAVYPLIMALRDENFGVQDAAMHSLISIGGEVTAYMVLPLLRDNAFLRNTALIILKSIGKITITLLYPLLTDKDDDVRKFALDLIFDIRHCDYLQKVVDILKADPNANVRASAAKVIGALQYKKAVPDLITALKDEEWVCFSALEALAEIRDEKSVAPIVDLLNSPSDAIRYAALESLGKIGYTDAADALLQHVSKIEGLEKISALKGLIQIGITPSITGIADTLIYMLKNGDVEDKLMAVKGLTAIQEKTAIYHIVDFAGSLDPSEPDNEERLFILKDAIRTFGCVGALVGLLEEPSIKFRGKVIAIDLIGDLKCKAAVPGLIKLSKSKLRDVRRASIRSLGEIDGDEAKNRLIDATEDRDSDVRKAAVAALGKISDMTAFQPLLKLLHTEQYLDVIEEAVRSLLNINPSLFLSRLGEYNEHIRKVVKKSASNSHLETQRTC